MGIFRSEKGDAAPTGSRRTAAAPPGQGAAADERRRRIETLFRQHSGRVLDYARHRVSTLAEAEDVVSEVFTVLTRRLEEAPLAPDEVLPWLLGVARKVLANQYRGERRRQALNERSEEAYLWANRGETDLAVVAVDNLILRQALAKLKDKEREALLLVTWDGLQYDEAAVALGITTGALAQRVVRGRQTLLEEIGHIRTYRDIEGSKRSDDVEQSGG
jgi:RNA polymerase sigma factor (sigma-70 family)